MLFYVILVLGTWKGVLAGEDKCDKNLYDVCVLPDDWQLPATREDVERMCPLYMQNIDCVNDYYRNCRSESEQKRKYRQDYRAVADEGCREDSQLHARIIENVGCLRDTVQNDIRDCQKFIREKRDAMMKHIERIAEEKGYDEGILDDELFTPYECLGHTLEAICFAAKSSARCGSDARDLVIDIVRRSGFQELYCAPASEDRLVEYITLLELELEDKTSLNQILERE